MTLPVSRTWLERKRAVAPDGSRPRPIDKLFPKQREVCESDARFKALLCGSRAGKSETILRHVVDAMQRTPGAPFLYSATTRPAAKNILWEPLRHLNREEGWGLELHETDLRARHPNGAWFLLAGMDKQPELEKARGIPWQGVYVDECGSHRPSYLKYYVNEVVYPRLMDRRGWCWLAGTPTSQATGFFYDITSGRLHGWETFHWTAKDNPHVPFHDFVYGDATDEGWLKRHQCTEDSPAFRREILGEWCVDSERLIFRFERERNRVMVLPALRPGDSWSYILTLDFGVGHHTAATVLAHPKKWGKDAYFVDSWQATGLAPSDSAVRIKETWDKWHPYALIGDVNGLGKGYQVEWYKHIGSEHEIPMRAAEKSDKRAALEIVSDRLHVSRLSDDWQQRRGLFVLGDVGANEELCAQFATLQWDEDRKDVAAGQNDDLAMSGLYGYRHCPAFTNVAVEPPPPPPEDAFERFRNKRLPPEPCDASNAFHGAFRRRR